MKIQYLRLKAIAVFSLFLLGGVPNLLTFSQLQAAAATTEKSKVKDVSGKLLKIAGPITKKAIELLEKLTEKQVDIKLSEILSFLKITGPLKTYMDRFIITTPKIKVVGDGLSLEGKVAINNIPVSAFMEIGLKNKKPYVIFYLQSPKKWLLSKMLPDIKLIPGKVGKELLAKFKVPDFVELEDSYLFISTVDMAKHPKLGKIYEGVGFKGKLRFIGIFEIVDKVLQLKGRPIAFEGEIKIPKLVGSFFEVSVPTEATLIPEKIRFKGKEIKFVPGFYATMAPFTLKILLTDIGPDISGQVGVKVKLPFLKEVLEFFGELALMPERLTLSLGQKTKVSDLFGIKGLKADDWRLGLSWDFAIASELAAASAVIGGVLGVLPTGVTFKGGLVSGKSDIHVDSFLALDTTGGLELIYKAKGDLDLKDFVRFWLSQIVKKPDLVNKVIQKVPYVVMKDISLNAAWSHKEEKYFDLDVGKVELLKGFPATLKIKVNKEGLIGSGSFPKIILPPPPRTPILTISRSTAAKKLPKGTAQKDGPSFDLTLGPAAGAFDIKADGLVTLDLGSLGKFSSDSIVDIASDHLLVKSKYTILDIDSDVTIKIDKSEKTGQLDPKTLTFDVVGTQKGLEKLSKLLTTLGTKVFVSALEGLQVTRQKAIADIKKGIQQLQVRNQANIDKLKKEISAAKVACDNQFRGLAIGLRPGCYLVRGIPAKGVAIGALEVHKNITLKAMQAIATGAVAIGLDVAKGAVAAAKAASVSIGKLTQTMNAFMQGGFAITYARLEGNAQDILKGKLPILTVKGHVLKKPFERKLQIDFKRPQDIPKNILKFLEIIK